MGLSLRFLEWSECSAVSSGWGACPACECGCVECARGCVSMCGGLFGGRRNELLNLGEV
jgi:hypothetical protein